MIQFPGRKRLSRTAARRAASRTRLALEVLEGRAMLAAFTDDFESGTLDPFWSTNQTAGSISFPSTTQAHSGSQSARFNSTQFAGDKRIELYHVFPTPVFGRVSVWMFDTGADVSSSNYLGMYVLNQSTEGAGFQANDYDLGPSNGGSYLANSFGASQINTGVDRTQSWHLLTIDTTPQTQTMSIDGLQVVTAPNSTPLTEVHLFMSGPTWRPAWTVYFDDFEFSPFQQAQPDILATGLTIDHGQVTAQWEVGGAELPADTSVALYWSQDDVFDGTDTLAHRKGISGDSRQTGSYSKTVPLAGIAPPPPGTSHLLLVVDPADEVLETDETNNGQSHGASSTFVDDGGNLIVFGSAGDDRIVLYAGNSGIFVRVNSERHGPFDIPIGRRLFAFGEEGNDFITVSGDLLQVAELHGGTGDDYLAGGLSADLIVGGPGSDRIQGGEGDNRLFGDGNEFVSDVLIESPEDGNDQVSGRGGADAIWGGGGNDSLYGADGDDTLDGGSGDDHLTGGNGSDILRGGQGRDTLQGGSGRDFLSGGDGDDQLFGGSDDDILVGGRGADYLRGDGENDLLAAGTTDQDNVSDTVLRAILAAWSTGSNQLTGNTADADIDRLYGDTGSDEFWADILAASAVDYVVSTIGESVSDEI